MNKGGATSGHALGSVRERVRLLIATIAVLSAVVISYHYWHNDRLSFLEGVANLYHLESILHCTGITEEVHNLSWHQSDAGPRLLHEDMDVAFKSKLANTLYVVEQKLSRITALQAGRGASSEVYRSIPQVLDKAITQLDAVKARASVVTGSGTGGAPYAAATLFEPFLQSIEQLRRLHVIARDRVNGQLEQLKATRHTYLLAIFGTALILGALVARQVLSGIQRSIAAQKSAEAVLRQSAKVFENTSEGVLITDADVRIIAANKAFTDITGYTEAEVLGRKPSVLKSGLHDEDFYRALWSSLRAHGQWQGEVADRRKNGEVFPKWLTISAVRDADGKLTNYVSVFSDITQLKESAERLRHLAHHDELTGLPNRLLLNARLEHSLQHASREGEHLAVLFVDIDHFKRINDSLGHPTGDRLLQQVAQRLLHCVREEDTVARLGGDELTIVLASLDAPDHAAMVAEEVLESLSKPFELEGHEIFVSASIGISIFPQDGRDATELLKHADAAMYKAKHEGRNRLHFYSSELTAYASERLALESDLHRALARDEFELCFQPQVSLQTGGVVGVEALIRWQHPLIGFVTPDRFIPQAEETGLIDAIGQWVLRTACAQAVAWREAGFGPLRIAVNLSGRQLAGGKIVDDVRQVLEETGLEATSLELELTESSVMQRPEHAQKTLDELRALGTTVAIDDFGTGYSSLSYLKRFAVDRLKIDRSFVRDIPGDANDVALARAIVALAGSLNLRVVAEGIETEAQRELLASMGCHEMQGYLFSKPVPAKELVRFLPAGEPGPGREPPRVRSERK